MGEMTIIRQFLVIYVCGLMWFNYRVDKARLARFQGDSNFNTHAGQLIFKSNKHGAPGIPLYYNQHLQHSHFYSIRGLEIQDLICLKGPRL